MARKFLFIINPNSGKRNSDYIITCIHRQLKGKFDYQIGLWTNLNEFNAQTNNIVSAGITDLIAVGGDGSVNLTASKLLNTNINLGIIPSGSGNGLARSLGIPLNPENAIQLILSGNVKKIDSGSVNGIPFFCTSGAGFDAHIGHLFADLKKRGLKTYIKLIVSEFFSYKPETYSVTVNNNSFSRKAFFITVANAGQFGNNFYIAPQAKLNDGLLNVVIVKPFNLFSAIPLLLKILIKKAETSGHIETISCNEVKVTRSVADYIHCDGEPSLQGPELHYKVHPLSLKVIIGNKFDGV